jgi:hypothetical protein
MSDLEEEEEDNFVETYVAQYAKEHIEPLKLSNDLKTVQVKDLEEKSMKLETNLANVDEHYAKVCKAIL